MGDFSLRIFSGVFWLHIKNIRVDGMEISAFGESGVCFRPLFQGVHQVRWLVIGDWCLGFVFSITSKAPTRVLRNDICLRDLILVSHRLHNRISCAQWAYISVNSSGSSTISPVSSKVWRAQVSLLQILGIVASKLQVQRVCRSSSPGVRRTGHHGRPTVSLLNW